MKQRDVKRKKRRNIIREYLKKNLKSLQQSGKTPVPNRCA